MENYSMEKFLIKEDDFDTEDFFGDEELDPELLEYTSETSFGTTIQHPLVYSLFHTPKLNKMVNKSLNAKKERLRDSLNKGDYNQYVFLHEKPYRMNAFLDIYMKLSKKEYYSLLSEIWINLENIWQYMDIVPKLLMMYPTHQKWMMNSEDRATLSSFPSTVEIYRGANNKNKSGWSWTIDFKKAEWFAKRFNNGGKVYKGICNKSDIIAYISERGESEVIIDPKKVKLIKDK